MPNYNWIPESFDEFRQATRQGRVQLSILGRQYTWLYANVLPWSPFRRHSYQERLLRRMMEREETFRAVHNYGIDLALYEEPSVERRLRFDIEGEAKVLAGWTLVSLVAATLLWFEGWHWAVLYSLPALVFAASSSLMNLRRDDPEQESRWLYPLWAVGWPFALVVYFLTKGRS